MILITRPIEQARTTRAKLKTLGHDVVCYPFLKIKYMDFIQEHKHIDALIITSQNAALAIRELSSLKLIRVFAVGNKTAETLRGFGFSQVISADSDGTALVDLIFKSQVQNSHLLYLHGDYIAGDIVNKLEPFYKVEDLIIYRSIANNHINQRIERLLNKEIKIILFYSPRTAEVFAHTITLNCSKISAICISKNTADKLENLTFKEIKISSHPSEDAMLELIEQ